ncbi:PEPxxWA-CTERM sorting domain-containing protein [Sandaracinobacteroides saxicola]|uniref:PEPxxWA-CTERM sorting domain-containing protein n=1 Tax=Sandaracinobacteroides saxicola TaxID=2759707 RepID=UPI001FB0F508|nr:PEPxxWA-CTERM sorting domain-containing protein [Sandaracinobacteroides saxicola]
MKYAMLAAVAAAALAAVPAQAIINAPVPTNAYIVFGGLDWAWANPCDATGGCGDIDLTYQGTQGWRLPTVGELAGRPQASDFLFRGANVPDGGFDPISLSRFGAGNDTPISVGSDGACAAAYFSTVWRHCDFGDGVAGVIFVPGGQNPGFSETWLVRGAVVPEPATWAMLISGFGLVGGALRRRRSVAA